MGNVERQKKGGVPGIRKRKRTKGSSTITIHQGRVPGAPMAHTHSIVDDGPPSRASREARAPVSALATLIVQNPLALP